MTPFPATHVKTVSALTLSLGLLTGCLSMPDIHSDFASVKGDPAQVSALEGKSRVFFFHGPVRTCKNNDCIDQKLNFPFAVYVDGVQVGAISDRDHYLRADIEPGKHLIQWKDVRDSPEGEQGDLVIPMEHAHAYFIRVTKDNRTRSGSSATSPSGAQITGAIENVGAAGQAELSGRALIVADQEAIRRIPSGHVTAGGRGDSQRSAAKGTIRDKLTELKELYDQKLITKDEYDGKRKKMLDNWD